MAELKKNTGKRRNIAVLGAQLNRAWGNEFMAGVLASARAGDVNVVCFVGGRPSTVNGGDSYGVYDLVKNGQFDGVLLSADLAHGLSEGEVAVFCNTLAPLPIASFSIPGADISSVMADNAGGMRAIARHLIETHRYERFAFVRGPAGQVEAEARYEAFLAELKEHKIRFDKNLVLDGDFSAESGRAAVRTLLDERGISVRAIVAANDRMAFGVLEALQERGIRVPEQIAVTGFDDVSESQSMGVPLTTVRQSFYEAGVRAFESLIARIDGAKAGESVTIPADLVVRWSCGCLPESIQRAAVLPREVAQTGRLENKRAAAIKALLGAAGVKEQDPARQEYVEAIGKAWDDFLAALRDTNKSEEFLKSAQGMVGILEKHGYDFNTWQNVLSTFRRYALGGISSTTTILHAENLFQQARMLAGELSQRTQAYRRLQLVKQEELLNNFSFSMASAVSFETIGDAIAAHFPNLGLKRWYVMYYDDADAQRFASQYYRLLMQYDEKGFSMPEGRSKSATGQLTPRGKKTDEHRHDAVVMPLSLAGNRFGFMWAEMGPDDWDVYVQVRNLLSSALLRVKLVTQREKAQREVERLLDEAHERAKELSRARDMAEKAASENALLYSSEQERRRGAEALARSLRQLSSLKTIEHLPDQILEQLSQVLPYDRGVFYLEDVNSVPRIEAHRGMPSHADMSAFQLALKGSSLYTVIARKGEALFVDDISTVENWTQPDWLPRDKAWMGVPLYSKDNVVGILLVCRSQGSFTQDDGLLAATFAQQANVALENARLYHEVTDMNRVMERMVAERVEDLNKAYQQLEKHDKNKSAFIQVAAHELRTPLTVVKGFIGMLLNDSTIQANPSLLEAIQGVQRGTNRLHQIVNSMLDMVRLESQTITPHFEPVGLGLILKIIHKDYVSDLAARNLTLDLDDTIKTIPLLWADSELLKKALDQLIVNAIKFTPDGGSIHISARVVDDRIRGGMAEIAIKDTGIGIDPEHHKVIFDKLYQMGEVKLHSSGRTNYKGGGAGLGLAIAAGIVRALQGKIWVESPGYDEEKFPGSTFFVLLPLMKE